jgi:hypothetical protein
MTKTKNKIYDSGNYLEKRYAGGYFSKKYRCTGKLGCRTSFDVSIPYLRPKENGKSLVLERDNFRFEISN